MVRVLIVEDDKLARKGLISALPWREYQMEVVGEAANGEKALEFLENTCVDLLITDLDMPGMGGIDLMRTVKERYPDTFMVVMTIYKDFKFVQEAVRLGAIDYIAKTDLDIERFDEILDRILKRIHAVSQKYSASKAQFEIKNSHLYSDEIVQLIKYAVDIINNEIGEPLYATEISKRLNISRSYFNQCFKDLVGKSFNDYLRYVRVDKAKFYLKNTNDSIGSIAKRIGYSDEKYFSQVFKEQTGMLPSRFKTQGL